MVHHQFHKSTAAGGPPTVPWHQRPCTRCPPDVQRSARGPGGAVKNHGMHGRWGYAMNGISTRDWVCMHVSVYLPMCAFMYVRMYVSVYVRK